MLSFLLGEQTSNDGVSVSALQISQRLDNSQPAVLVRVGNGRPCSAMEVLLESNLANEPIQGNVCVPFDPAIPLGEHRLYSNQPHRDIRMVCQYCLWCKVKRLSEENQMAEWIPSYCLQLCDFLQKAALHLHLCLREHWGRVGGKIVRVQNQEVCCGAVSPRNSCMNEPRTMPTW